MSRVEWLTQMPSATQRGQQLPQLNNAAGGAATKTPLRQQEAGGAPAGIDPRTDQTASASSIGAGDRASGGSLIADTDGEVSADDDGAI